MTTALIEVGLDEHEKLAAKELRTYVEDKKLYLTKRLDSYGHRGGNLVAVINWIRSTQHTGSVVVHATSFDGFLNQYKRTIQTAKEVFEIIDHAVQRTDYLGGFLVGENYWSNNNSDRKTGNVSGVLPVSTDKRTPMNSKVFVIGPAAVELIKALTQKQYRALYKMLYGRQTLEDLAFTAFLQVLTGESIVRRDNRYVCLPVSTSWKDPTKRAFDLRKLIAGCPRNMRTAFKDRMWTYLRGDKKLCTVLGKAHNGRFNASR